MKCLIFPGCRLDDDEEIQKRAQERKQREIERQERESRSSVISENLDLPIDIKVSQGMQALFQT